MSFTPEKIAELREICQNAHPGPWTHVIEDDDTESYVGGLMCIHSEEGPMEVIICSVMTAFSDNEEDGIFIAAAREALPLLLDEVERLQKLKAS